MTKKMTIPLLDLKKEYIFFKKDIDKQIESCLESQEWILGPKVKEFEDKAAQYLGAKYAVGVASGTDALILALRAFALRLRNRHYFDEKDEIITAPFSFIATAEAIVRSGARPVFVDIDPDTFNIDPAKIKQAINRNTVGIIPVHLYGLACEMELISEIAKAYQLFVVEDAAQAFGASYKGKKTGTFGNLGAFSFFPSKNLGAFGDGGLVTTGDGELAESVKTLRNHGQRERYNADFIGYNSRLDSIQAAVLLAKLKYIDQLNKLRKKIAQMYNNKLKNTQEIKIPHAPQEADHVYHLYTIKVSRKRDKLLAHLNSQGIDARIYYPFSLYKMKAFMNAKYSGELKGTEKVLSEALSLPIYPFLEKIKVNYIIEHTCNFFTNG
jgi:dTDP-4-amino-4,6-dideoxygalactose transaminase